jgi:hypothetical protein
VTAPALRRATGEEERYRITSTVIAGIPVRQHAPPDLDVRQQLSIPWREGAATEPPLHVHHVRADVPLAGMRAVRRGPGWGPYRYFIDDAGRLAVELDARMLDHDGALHHFLQRMRTVEPGYRYELQYTDDRTAALGQLPWQRLIFMNAVASRRRGLVAHACGFSLGGAGVLAPGVSGTGKSTLARLLAEHAAGEAVVHSDDRIVLAREGAGFRLWGTPWPSQANLADERAAPLGALLVVRRGDRPVVREIPKAEAARALVRAVALPFWDEGLMTEALEMVDALLASVIALEFSYAPGPDAARLLLREVRSASGAR